MEVELVSSVGPGSRISMAICISFCRFFGGPKKGCRGLGLGGLGLLKFSGFSG